MRLVRDKTHHRTACFQRCCTHRSTSVTKTATARLIDTVTRSVFFQRTGGSSQPAFTTPDCLDPAIFLQVFDNSYSSIKYFVPCNRSNSSSATFSPLALRLAHRFAMCRCPGIGRKRKQAPAAGRRQRQERGYRATLRNSTLSTGECRYCCTGTCDADLSGRSILLTCKKNVQWHP